MKRRYWLVIVLALSLLVVSCVPEDTSRTVRFYASSTSGKVSVDYYCGDDRFSGDLISLDNQVSPWSIETEAEKGDWAELFAGNLIDEEGLTARIYIDGKLFQDDTEPLFAWVCGWVE